MKNYFQLDDAIIHLNHAAVAPWPSVTRDAVNAFASENVSIGSQRYDLWMQTVQQLKLKLASLINAQIIDGTSNGHTDVSSDEIAILKNTSEGLSLIAQGLSFKPGDNIVIPAEEFPSNKVVWQSLQTQGVELRCISIQESEEPERALIDVMDENTRLLSCSSVQFARGLRLNLNQLGEACKRNETLFCVDAIQSLGAIAFDVQACQADFVVADGHKWMCAPEGTALFYCRKEIQPQLQLRQYGWYMRENPYDFTYQSDDQHDDCQPGDLHISNSARRFECGSPNMMGITALNASLGLLLEIGIEKIEQAVLNNTEYLFQQLAVIPGVTLLSTTTPGRYAGIVTFQKQDVDTVKLYQFLQDNNVICANRGGGIRFSPHFYTSHETIDRALELVAAYSE